MKKNVAIIILSMLLASCSSELDFDQVNDLKVEPVVVANLASFDVAANEFVSGGIEQPIPPDLLNFNLFRSTYFKKSLVRADLFFEFDNTVNRAYTINLAFLDASNTPVYSIPFDVPANTTGFKRKEIFENTKLDVFKTATKFVFVVTMLPGPALTENSLGSLKFRSSATVYLKLE